MGLLSDNLLLTEFIANADTHVVGAGSNAQTDVPSSSSNKKISKKSSSNKPLPIFGIIFEVLSGLFLVIPSRISSFSTSEDTPTTPMQAPDLVATEYDSFVMNCRVIFRNFKSSVNAMERVPAEFVDVYERGVSPRHNSNSVVDKITPVEAVNDSAHRSEWMTDSVLLALYQRLNLILGEIIPGKYKASKQLYSLL